MADNAKQAETKAAVESAQLKQGVLETEEFKSAVKAAASAAVAEMMQKGVPLGGDNAEMKSFFSQMALQIAEISDQGTNRKRVAPEILAKRAEARKRLDALMAKVREQKLQPEYKVVAKVYLNERLIEPYRRLDNRQVVNQEIIWTGIPNDAMRPINGIAKEIFHEFRESVGSVDRIATLDNRPNWVTPAGLVVKGDGPQRAIVKAEQEFEDGLAVKDNNDPNAPFVHVLGTIAKPAARNVSQFPSDPLTKPARAQESLI